MPRTYRPFRASRILAAALLLPLAAAPLLAQTDSSLLTVERIFASDEFTSESVGDVRWIPGASAYTRLEPDSAMRGAAALIRYDAATGRRDVWVPATRLVPPGDSVPLAIEGLRASRRPASACCSSPTRVGSGAQNTRGDFWVLDLATWKLRKLGGPDAAPSSLMFAKFSPDGGRVAYVREHDLYVESAGRRRASPGSPATARAPSSTAPSTGCTRKSSTCATGSAGARTGVASRSGSSTRRACATST